MVTVTMCKNRILAHFSSYFSCANVIIRGSTSPSDLEPIYRSWDGSTAPYAWDDESGSWRQDSDGNWNIFDPLEGLTSSEFETATAVRQALGVVNVIFVFG